MTIELKQGLYVNVRDLIKEYMPCNVKIGSCSVWKRYDYRSNKVDDGLRYLLQPLLNNMFLVRRIYSINGDKNPEIGI